MTRGGEADQRDAPTVCLILSYVSRLNGSCCYLPHHSFSFLSEGRHAQTQQSLGRTGGSEHGKVTLSLNALTTGQAIYQKFFWGEAMCLIFFFTLYPPNQSLAHQQSWGLTDVIKQSPEEIRCNSIRITMPLKSTERQRPNAHSCPHTCYHMLLSNMMFNSRILSVHLHSI